MSTDRFRDFSNGPLAKRLGIPRVPVLRRFEPGQPLLAGPALVAGSGRFAKSIAALVTEEGSRVVEEAGEEKLAAVVLDLTDATTLEDLAAARAVLQPAVRRIAPSGRVLLLGPSPSDVEGVEAAAVAGSAVSFSVSLSARQDENWPMILSATSEITPRPNCAGRPVMVMSVTIVTSVLSGPSAVIEPVTVAFAVPLPRESRPVASMTTRCVASSRST